VDEVTFFNNDLFEKAEDFTQKDLGEKNGSE